MHVCYWCLADSINTERNTVNHLYISMSFYGVTAFSFFFTWSLRSEEKIHQLSCD